MRAYTDETYYINDYLKGRKPVITAGFLFYARSASQVIDWYTFNRLKGVSDVPEGEAAEGIRREDVGEDWHIFSRFCQCPGICYGNQQGTAQHCYEMAGSYRSVLSGGVICISMRM